MLGLAKQAVDHQLADGLLCHHYARTFSAAGRCELDLAVNAEPAFDRLVAVIAIEILVDQTGAALF